MSGTAIATVGLTRCFGALTAVDGVDLEVGEGEIYGFLGRNGQGKTTLIRMLLGLIRPTRGRAVLLGRDVAAWRNRRGAWSDVGYLVEGPGLYPQLTVGDHLRAAARYRRLPARAGVDVLDRLDLAGSVGVRAGALSLGNRQRLGLALALLHRPRLLVLDEPVNGLDPAGVVQVRELLREVAADGSTVFMSTHLLPEVSRLADRVGIIHRGRLVEELTAQRLAATDRRLVVRLPAASMAAVAAGALRAAHLDVTTTVGEDGVLIVCTDERAVERPQDVNRALVLAGAPPAHLAVEREDLEEHFLQVTGEEAR